MRITSLLLLATLFVVLASNYSLRKDWHSSLSAFQSVLDQTASSSYAVFQPTNASSVESEEVSATAEEELVQEQPAPIAATPQAPAQKPESPAPKPAVAPSPATAAQIEAEVVRLSNVERAKISLNDLTVDATLAATAQEQSEDMLDRDFFSHDNPDGCSSSCRTTAAGYKWQMVGENIYMMSGWNLTPTEAAVMIVNGWMSSAGHRENLLKGGYTETGVGIILRGEAVYATALYAKPR